MEPAGEVLRFCEHCGRKASREAVYCGGCGRALEVVEEDEPAAPDDEEPAREKPSRTGAGAGSAGEQDVLAFRPLAVETFLHLGLCIVTLGIWWLVLRLGRLRTSYRITTQRIEISTGFFNVTRQSIELFRIQDFEVREPLFLRIRSSGDLLVRSMDQGEPLVILAAVPEVKHVHETLRRLVAEERRRVHVRTIEDGDED